VAFVFVAALIFVAGQLPRSAQAQDGETIQWGEAKLGQVTGPAGTFYNFQGVSGDTASVEVLGVGGFSPRVAVLDASRNVLVQDDNAAASNTVNVSQTLAVDGLYYIQVTGLNDSVGQFTVSLNRGLPEGIPIPPPGTDTIQGVVSPDFPTVYYDFNPSPTDHTRIEIRSLTDGYSPVANVYSNSGESIASVSSQRLVAASLEFGPGTEPLKLAVQLGAFTTQADFQVTVVVVPSPSTSAAPVTGSCVLASADGNDVNIRSGGSTNHPAVGVMRGGTTMTATGYNSTNGGWYEVQLPGGSYGWMASFVLTTTGDCSTLPIKSYPAAPAGSGSNTGGGPSSTEEPSSDGGTSTQEPGTTPTDEPTEEPVGQTAPPDGDPVYNLELNFKSNDTRTVSDVISYPNGDTTDRVRYEVKGFDSVTFAAESTVTLVCTGPGAENARVHFGAGNGPGVPCNGATRTFNHGEFTAIEQFIIFLDSGDNAYVTWTAVISARRG
jgi:uncharacterized protein YraI